MNDWQAIILIGYGLLVLYGLVGLIVNKKTKQ